MDNTIICLNTWKRFVNEGVLDTARLNKRVIESWYRCKNNNVNPYLNKGTNILTNDLLNLQRNKNSMLMEIALPHLEKIDPFIKESGMMALLVDTEGYVLSLSGNENIKNQAKKINFVEGVRWTESEVGTNAIGTALQTGEPVMINGTEHYSIASHQWSCSATPIYHDGLVLGVIDVSCPVDNTNPLMLGMVASLAFTIEKEIMLYSYKMELELVQKSMKITDTYRDQNMVVCNQEQTVIAETKAIRDKCSSFIGKKLEDVLTGGFEIEAEMPIYQKNSMHIQGKCFKLREAVAAVYWNVPLFVPVEKKLDFDGEPGTSKAFHQTLQQVKKVAKSNTNVYLWGETGSGKEIIAKTIHINSTRSKGPFIALNCGAIPKELIESELFGYVEGAFTGANRKGYKGKFEQANGGTLFLDEIGEISHSMQVALLRIIQERKVVPLGGSKEIPIDIRIITATNRDLEQLVKDGKFRKDLYYRLNVFPIRIPALRERKEDIPYLVSHFCKINNWDVPITSQIIERLCRYDWPGNIRELMNAVERLNIIFGDGSIKDEELNDFFETLTNHNDDKDRLILDDQGKKYLSTRDIIQRDLMLEALRHTQGNVTSAAKLLEIPRSTFYKRLQKYGL